MRFLPNVNLKKMSVQLLTGLYVLDHLITKELNCEMTVTHVCDGKHNPGTLHPTGDAADVRIKDFDGNMLDISAMDRQSAQRVVDLFKERMPGYDIILEKDHIHLEYDPK